MRKIDLVGEPFGRLTVIAPAPPKAGCTYWVVKCSCGVKKTVSANSLHTKTLEHSCGCATKEKARALMAAIRAKQHEELEHALTDRRFTHCVAKERIGFKDGTAIWNCLCDCGREFPARGNALVYRSIKSCGCRRGNPLQNGIAMRNQLLKSYKIAAQNRELVWGLSEAEFNVLTKGSCHYCGVPPSSVKRSKTHRGEYIYNGIDRMDSDQGYIPDNVVSCCHVCNFAKRDTPYTDFLLYLDRLTDFHAKKTSSELFSREIHQDGVHENGECRNSGLDIPSFMGENAWRTLLPTQDSVHQ